MNFYIFRRKSSLCLLLAYVKPHGPFSHVQVVNYSRVYLISKYNFCICSNSKRKPHYCIPKTLEKGRTCNIFSRSFKISNEWMRILWKFVIIKSQSVKGSIRVLLVFTKVLSILLYGCLWFSGGCEVVAHRYKSKELTTKSPCYYGHHVAHLQCKFMELLLHKRFVQKYDQ